MHVCVKKKKKKKKERERERELCVCVCERRVRDKRETYIGQRLKI